MEQAECKWTDDVNDWKENYLLHINKTAGIRGISSHHESHYGLVVVVFAFFLRSLFENALNEKIFITGTENGNITFAIT